ncbi:2-amino-4-hydroxy-6-hydroxymethyldihydropteridine diphosphokinase [Rhodoflexus caldus]|uniref:2-amino-4-hydroxy-6- hydroxymethyldihydropteridine diphosphokinase n=1 Tax=Rhodoflexus caldus TaxID=2891236 RepID=UPI00202A04C2|nr:2-amino-4-hydroxy-6-hydroxymethyldihydropteridine diphosphokinase [Rhodoflexus caldus]
MPKYTAHLLLGTNMGNRCDYLHFALKAIQERAGYIYGVSPVYETAAWGFTDQNDFLNQALTLQTHWQPEELLAVLQEIEQQAGRQRLVHWGPRTLDIDIIAIDDLVIESERLVVPHPAMRHRRFVLQPLADLVPDWRHPVLGLTCEQMLALCTDDTAIKKYDGCGIFDSKRI